MDKATIDEALSDWTALNRILLKSTEDECFVLLGLEREGKKRPSYLKRIYGRYSELKRAREKKELL